MSRQCFVKNVIAGLMITVVCSVGLNISHAFGNQASLGITPTVRELLVEEGEQVQGTFRVRNQKDYPVDVRIDVNNLFAKERDDFSVEDYIRFDAKEFQLAPKEERVVIYTIMPNVDFPPEVAARVFFTDVSEEKGIFDVRIGAALYVIVSGKEHLESRITDLFCQQKDAKKEEEFTKLQFVFKQINTGNVHIRPSGTLDIYNQNGQKVLSKKIPVGRPVFPSNEEMFFISVELAALETGHYEAHVSMDYGKMYRKKDLVTTENINFVIDEDGNLIADEI